MFIVKFLTTSDHNAKNKTLKIYNLFFPLITTFSENVGKEVLTTVELDIVNELNKIKASLFRRELPTLTVKFFYSYLFLLPGLYVIVCLH